MCQNQIGFIFFIILVALFVVYRFYRSDHKTSGNFDTPKVTTPDTPKVTKPDTPKVANTETYNEIDNLTSTIHIKQLESLMSK
jgi:hypothetical protein